MNTKKKLSRIIIILTTITILAGLLFTGVFLSHTKGQKSETSQETSQETNQDPNENANAASDKPDYIDRLVEKYDPTGASVAVIEDGKIKEVRNYGYADLENSKKVSDETRFKIASISKTTTAYGVMQLVDEGKLDLDAPVNSYLTQWKIPDGEYDGDKVTLRMLLSHTSGVSYTDGGGSRDPENLPSIAEELSMDDVHLVREPGSTFSYSEFTGSGICQLVIEEITGEKFEDYMVNDVFQKIGMEHTDYAYGDNEKGKLAKLYAGEGKQVEQEKLVMIGAGGITTTSQDLARFAIALMNYKNNTDSEMFVAQKNTENMGAYYGLGIIPRPLPDGRCVYEHNGTLTGCNAQMALEPESGDGIVVLTNSDKAFYLTYDLMEEWSEHALGQHVVDTQIQSIKDKVNTATIVIFIVVALMILQLGIRLKKKKLIFASGVKRVVVTAVFLALFVWFCYIIMYTDWFFVKIWNRPNYFLYTFFPLEIRWTMAGVIILAVVAAVRMNMKRYA